VRILLADSQPGVRFALRALLRQRPELKVVGEAVDAEDLLAQAEAACPDLVLLDWRLRGLAVADLLSALRRACPGVYVIVLSGRLEARRAILDAGADAFVSKADSPERLLGTIASCWARSTSRVEG
jgi:DNA-binding NarL/FixJ family response regulator